MTNTNFANGLSNYVTNPALDAFKYASTTVANTFSALQTFSGLNVTSDSSFGDVSGNFLQQIPIIRVSGAGSSGAPNIISIQTAMQVFIEYISSTIGYIRLTTPNTKYFGQRYVIMNKHNKATVNISVPSGNVFGGSGNGYSTFGGYLPILKNVTCEVIYVGIRDSAHTF